MKKQTMNNKKLTTVKLNLHLFNFINTLAPFFEDSYISISVRAYARATKNSPPTASKILKQCEKSGYLIQNATYGRLLFTLNNENTYVKDFCRIYWKKRLEKLTKAIETKLTGATLILFGSLSKAEAKPESDIDLAIFAPAKKTLELTKFEKKLKRKISLHWFTFPSKIKNKQLLNNILNGKILTGKIKW